MISKILRTVLVPLATFAKKTERHAYWILAIAVAIAATADILTFNLLEGVEKETFDRFMRNRIEYSSPDPNIVLLDIDEPSLSHYRPYFGDWPWPREMSSSIVELLQYHQVKSIIFDINFISYRPGQEESDESLIEAAKKFDNVYFSMWRLPENVKTKHDMRESPIAGKPAIFKLKDSADPDQKAIVEYPYFIDQLPNSQNRVGTVNTKKDDDDGVVRHFELWSEINGWGLQSLPYSFAKSKGIDIDANQILINWRGPRGTYPTMSVYPDYDRLNTLRAQNKKDPFLKDKIVLIGSTATMLGDTHSTPMSIIHPGTEILATVIDNVMHDDYYRELPEWFYIILTIVMLWYVYWWLSRDIHHDIIDVVRIALESSLVAGISYLSLSFSPIYVDAATPLTYANLYFAIAFAYGRLAQLQKQGHPLVSMVFLEGKRAYMLSLHVKIDSDNRAAAEEAVKKIKLKAKNLFDCAVMDAAFSRSYILEKAQRHQLMVYWADAATSSESVKKECEQFKTITRRIANEIMTNKQCRLNLAFSEIEQNLQVGSDGEWLDAGFEGVLRCMSQNGARDHKS